MPTVEQIEEVYEHTWKQADQLKNDNPELWFFNVNRGEIMNKEVNRTTWAFDYVVACTKEQGEKIKELIEDYRNSEPNSKTLFPKLEAIEKEASKYPHVIGYWV